MGPRCSSRPQVRELPGGEEPAADEGFLRSTLRHELRWWRRRHPGGLAMDALERMAGEVQERGFESTTKAVLIYDGTWYWPMDNPNRDKRVCPQPCDGTFRETQTTVQEALDDGTLKWPNVMFWFNVHDNDLRLCLYNQTLDQSRCSVPVLSLIKWMGGGMVGDYAAEGFAEDSDVLVPQLHQQQPAAVTFPWRNKLDVAFFRGTGFCMGYTHMFYACSRTYLAYQTAFKGMNDTLDAGLTSGWKVVQPDEPLDNVVDRPIPRAKHVPFSHHAVYRYLLALDGVSASFRFSKLLSTDSVVLKQGSYFAEWYYRALRPWTHYVPFWTLDKDDYVQVVRKLRAMDKEQPQVLIGIAQRAQRFARRYLGPRARLLYWTAALREYKSLLPGMDKYIERLVAGGLLNNSAGTGAAVQQ